MKKEQIVLQNEEEQQLQTVDQYQEQCLLDKGGQGEVHLMSKDNHLYAVKLPLQNINITKFEKQQHILADLKHENIIKLQEYKQAANVRYSNKIQVQQQAMVLEFAQQGDLFYLCYKKRFSEPVCRVLFQQILSALKYFHQQKKLMHLDLKVQNILVDENFTIKISDFGHAMYYQQVEKGATFGYGTDLFRPPQYGDMNKFNGEKVDIFNVGMIFFQLLIGRQPLYSRSQPFRNDKIYRLIRNKKFDSFWKTFQNQLNLNVSYNAKRLIVSMLSQDPKQRPTIDQIFKSQWFTQTKAATHEQVVSQFLPKKQKLLGMKKKKLIQEIKSKFQVIRNIKNIFDAQKKKNENKIVEQNQQKEQLDQANFRQSSQYFIRMYHDFTNDKNMFTNIQKKNIFQVKYFKTNPSLLVCMLKNVVSNLFKSKQLIINDQFLQINPLSHLIQIQDVKKGILKATFQYETISTVKVQEIENNQPSEKIQRKWSQDNQQLVKIQITGQVVKKQKDMYGIFWKYDHENNRNNLWKKQFVTQLNSICQNLLD